MKIIYFKILVLILLPFSVFAQPTGNTGVTVTEESAPESRRKIYSTFKYKPGYYKGIMLMSFIAGGTHAASGCYIQHEKNFDKSNEFRIAAGDIQTDFMGNKAHFFQPEYIPGDSGEFDLEYGLTDHIGLGFSMIQFSIYSIRQDLYNVSTYNSNPLYQRDVIDFVPQERLLYRGSIAAFLANYHFLDKSFFDPYVSVKAGVLLFKGEGHETVYNDPARYNNNINNGLGTYISAGAGLNIHFGHYWGMKTEASYSRQFLRSDMFKSRTLNVLQVQIGLFMNYTNVARSDF